MVSLCNTFYLSKHIHMQYLYMTSLRSHIFPLRYVKPCWYRIQEERDGDSPPVMQRLNQGISMKSPEVSSVLYYFTLETQHLF